MIGKTLWTYVFWSYLKIGFYLAIVICALCILVDFTQTAARLSSMPHYNVKYAFIISTLRAPFLLLQALPFIALLSALINFYLLNKSLELVIIRTAGLSAWQFLRPIAAGAFLLGIIGVFILNPIGAFGLNAASDFLLKWRGNSSILESNKPYTPWLVQKNKDGSETSIGITAIDKHVTYQTILNQLNHLPKNIKLEEVINDLNKLATQGKHEYLSLLQATFVIIKPINSTVKASNPHWYYVTNAILLPGYWLLLKPVEYSEDVMATFPAIATISTSIKQQALEEYIRDPNSVAFYDLNDKIKTAKSFGYSAYPLQMILHKLISLPILNISMVLIAAMVSIRFARFINVKLYMLGGLIAGFILYVITILAQDFGKLGIIAPVIAAWTPVCIALFIGCSFILRHEDG